MADYEIMELPNGIKILHKQIIHTKIAHCGLILDIGSRDEKPGEEGITHFWEHMAFKGTKKRKAFHILNRLDSVGGELNAYTTKEKIVFHASTLSQHFDMLTDLLADIVFHSTFPEKQLEIEKKVILEEIAMYLDSHEDAILDDFEKLIFQNHSLGNNILGANYSVKSFKRDHFLKFLEENIDTSRIVFSSVSPLPFKKVLRTAEKYLASVPLKKQIRDRLPINDFHKESFEVYKPLNQTHNIIGGRTFSLHDPKRIPFYLLINLLGGPCMNSRLNMSVREKQGLVYAIDAHVSLFSDIGYFYIYYTNEVRQQEKCRKLVLQELNRTMTKKLSKAQLEKAKQQLIGQMAMNEENNMGLMLAAAKSYLDRGEFYTFEEVCQQIMKITSEDIVEVANEVFNHDNLCYLSFLSELK